MATKYVKQAGKQLEPVYGGAIADVNAQIPATQALYEALVSGLEGQADTGVEDIVADAERRGVGRARLAQDVGGTLGSAVDLERARLGSQQAGDIAGITGQLSELRQGRVMGRQDLGDALQAQGIAKAENRFNLRMARAQSKQEMNEARKQYELDLLTLERNAELDRLAQASASSGGGGGGEYASTGVSGGGGGGVNPPAEFLSYLAGKGDMRQYSRATMDKFVNQWFEAKGIKSNKNRQAYWDLRNQYYNINPKPGRG